MKVKKKNKPIIDKRNKLLILTNTQKFDHHPINRKDQEPTIKVK